MPKTAVFPSSFHILADINMTVVAVSSFTLTYLQKFITSLTEDREVIFQDVFGLHRGDVAIRWHQWIRARLS